jgi:integrase
MGKEVKSIFEEVRICAIFPDEQSDKLLNQLKVEVTAKGATVGAAIFHGLDAIFERKDVHKRKPGIIKFEVRTQYYREDVSLYDFTPPRRKVRAFDARLRKTNSFPYRPHAGITFRELAQKWNHLHLPFLKPSTQQTFTNHINRWLLPAFGDFNLHEIGSEAVQTFISSIPRSPKLIRNIVATFRVIWKAGKGWQYVDHNCFDGIRMPRHHRRTARFFSLDEMRRIIAAAIEPYRTLFWIAAETGLRSGELCGLTVESLDLEHSVLTVRQSAWNGKLQEPKTPNAIRRCLLSDSLAEHLKNYLANICRPNELNLLFPSRAGTPHDNMNLLKRHLYPLLAKLNIQRAGFHAFRHGNSSVMDHLGVPLKVRQDRLGHADVALTLNTYTHKLSEDERILAQQLGASLKPTT